MTNRILALLVTVIMCLFSTSVVQAEDEDSIANKGIQACEHYMDTNGYASYPGLKADMCNEVKTYPEGACMVAMMAAEPLNMRHSILVKGMCRIVQTRGQFYCFQAMFQKGYEKYPILVHGMCLKAHSKTQGRCAADSILTKNNEKYPSLVANECGLN